MRIRLLFAMFCVLALAGCGSGGTVRTTTTAPTTTAPNAGMAVTVFRVEAGRLRAESVRVPETRAVAAAALRAVGVGAAVTISDGTARVDLAHADAARTAEIVYTLTQFPSVQRVDVAGRAGLERSDVADGFLAPIFVETPADGAVVPRTFRLAGSASVFEATLVVELRRGGRLLERRTVTASEGAPARGSFAATFRAGPGAVTIRAFAPSAADGSPQHEVDVHVTVAP